MIDKKQYPSQQGRTNAPRKGNFHKPRPDKHHVRNVVLWPCPAYRLPMFRKGLFND